MSYLLQHTQRPQRPSRIRLDEELRLNRPGFYGDAYIRTLVLRSRSGRLHIELRIADCVNVINLEFSLDTPEHRENSLFKADTLIGALTRFRDALAAECELDEKGGTR
jgi:hypothetical protein